MRNPSPLALVPSNGVERALTSLFTELNRVARYGFTQTELDRYRRGVAEIVNDVGRDLRGVRGQRHGLAQQRVGLQRLLLGIEQRESAASELVVVPHPGSAHFELFEHLLLLMARGAPGPEAEPTVRRESQDVALRQALLDRKRVTVLRLRDERVIDDTVLRQVQARLDIEELRLERGRMALD